MQHRTSPHPRLSGAARTSMSGTSWASRRMPAAQRAA